MSRNTSMEVWMTKSWGEKALSVFNYSKFTPRNNSWRSSYRDGEQIELQYDGQSQLQQKDPGHDLEPPFTSRLDVVSEIECNKGGRHETGYTSNYPSEKFQGNNR